MNSFNKYNPDVLSCLANLSNDEVFTSPKSANKMLDLLPSTIWRDENAQKGIRNRPCKLRSHWCYRNFPNVQCDGFTLHRF